MQSKRWAARLPFDRPDVLLIDEIGKNISGTGFDVSVAGRKYLDHEPAPDEYPKVRIVALRNLTDLSGGNAEGMGLAEFCRTRLIDQADLHITRINALTSGHYTGAMLPIDFETDTELLQVVLTEIGLTSRPTQADLDPQHPGSWRGRVRRRLLGRGAQPRRPGGAHRPAAAPLRRGRQPARRRRHAVAGRRPPLNGDSSTDGSPIHSDQHRSRPRSTASRIRSAVPGSKWAEPICAS